MFSIIIPLFNEEKNIISLLDEITFYLKDNYEYELVLINDFSKDNTLNVINKYTSKKNIKIINNKKNKGQSYSVFQGIKNSNFDTIITIDGDGQNNPKDIKSLIEIYNLNNKTKLVAGIRLKRKDNLIKIFSSRIANSIRSKIFNDGCKDTGCSLKIFDKKIFLSFPYFNGIHRFIPSLFVGYGYSVKFEGVDHRKRTYGNSKYGTFDRLIRGIRDIIIVRNIINNKKKNDIHS
jgi:dolichol-phosphate mannosyltransferase